jgi:hypothetical protein
MKEHMIKILEKKNQKILDAFDLLSEEEQLDILSEFDADSYQTQQIFGKLAKIAFMIFGVAIIRKLYNWWQNKKSTLTKEEQEILISLINKVINSKNNAELKKNKKLCVDAIDEFIIKYPVEQPTLEQIKESILRVTMADLK